jgi:hypothetical protein
VKARALVTVATLACLAACGGAAVDARYPPRPEGCDVKIYEDTPEGPTDNLGPVQATCSEDVSKEDCLRTLKDQACKLGGDLVWGVEDKPHTEGGKNRWSGRAAHTRAPKAPASPSTK